MINFSVNLPVCRPTWLKVLLLWEARKLCRRLHPRAAAVRNSHAPDRILKVRFAGAGPIKICRRVDPETTIQRRQATRSSRCYQTTRCAICA